MKVKSEIKFYPTKNWKDYCIEAKAFFEILNEDEIIDFNTDYTITELKVNNIRMESIEQVAEFMRADFHELQKQIQNRFIEYADNLPF